MLREIAITPSGNIEAVSYDDDEMTLYIQFKSGAVYQYDQVPGDVVTGLTTSLSSGEHFYRAIRGKFAYQKVDTNPD